VAAGEVALVDIQPVKLHSVPQQMAHQILAVAVAAVAFMAVKVEFQARAALAL
jgi:hypothetical protein